MLIPTIVSLSSWLKYISLTTPPHPLRHAARPSRALSRMSLSAYVRSSMAAHPLSEWQSTQQRYLSSLPLARSRPHLSAYAKERLLLHLKHPLRLHQPAPLPLPLLHCLYQVLQLVKEEHAKII